MRLRIARIHEAARDRPAGYVEEVLSHGSSVDGEWLEISSEALGALRKKYRSEPSPSTRRGLGDAIEALVKPVAVALRLPCLDQAWRLKANSPCARRRDALNRAFPF